MSVKAVIGLGFGDEGKGIATDYLCSNSSGNTLVVRFSGGHQAGHTVNCNGVRHVFSNFGSGTIRGIPTYWSKFCTIDPVGIIREMEILKQQNISPTLFIDQDCPIVTPYDKFKNQIEAIHNENGSCGVGFGTTIEREENLCSFTFGDLMKYPEVAAIKFQLVGRYYKWIADNNDLEEFKSCCDKLRESPNVKIPDRDAINDGYDNYIFEGSQGLLLDKDIGFFPHVTRGNTGTKNLLRIASLPELYLVTRAYQTRHGNGPMTNEGAGHNIKIDTQETNQTNTYQGPFRRSVLDLDLLLYGMEKDEGINRLDKNLVITCLDHVVGNWKFTLGGKLNVCSSEDVFVDKIKTALGIHGEAIRFSSPITPFKS